MVAVRAPRRKRASATDLYKTCKAAGTCPPDVIPKIEGSTLADKILQWSGLGIFLGGLGIGTGTGSGGRTGYIPLGGGGRPSVVDIGPTRPPIIIEPVGPTEPSIVTLVEESSIIQSGAPIPTFSGGNGFELTTSSATTPAVLDITPSAGTVHVTSTNIQNPLYIEPPIDIPQAGEASGHIFTTTSTAGTHSYEEIPMEVFASTNGTGLEPISSTPIPGIQRVSAPRLYSKAYQQVKVTDPNFIGNPSTFVTFDNPAYEPIDETLTYASSSTVAPDPDFLDIIALHRPALTSRKGTVRYSRLGQKATMKTRSGKQIGATVHYYHDISPIQSFAEHEEIELQPLHTSTHSSAPLFDIYADPDTVPSIPTPRMSYSPTTLPVPRYASNVFSSINTSTTNVTVPLSTSFELPVYSGSDIYTPTSSPTWPSLPPPPTTNLPAIVVHGDNYYLWPYIYLIHKRRKRMPYFFSDGFVAY